MENLDTKTIGEIALEMPNTTRVFEEFKIDYCCGGGKTFMEACESAGADPKIVLEKISRISESEETVELGWIVNASLSQLVDYLEDKHHTFTKTELGQLLPLMEKVARVHGERHPELLELQGVFQTLCDDLLPHLRKEEMILFPYVREMEFKLGKGYSATLPNFGSVQHPVQVMMTEHDTDGELLVKMRELSKDYKIPEDACSSFTALYTRMKALEKDLHQHIHLENNLVFPKAVELERELIYR